MSSSSPRGRYQAVATAPSYNGVDLGEAAADAWKQRCRSPRGCTPSASRGSPRRGTRGSRFSPGCSPRTSTRLSPIEWRCQKRSTSSAPWDPSPTRSRQRPGRGPGRRHELASDLPGENNITGGPGPVAQDAHTSGSATPSQRRLGRNLAERGVRDLFRAAVRRALYDGRDAFVAGWSRRSRDTVFSVRAAETRRGRRPSPNEIHDNLSDTGRILNPLVYQKGGWTLHMLRGLGGYRQVLGRHPRLLQEVPGRACATTDDLRAGHGGGTIRPGNWFFKQWLNRSGVPKIGGEWRYNAERKQVEVSLSQSQAGDAFRLPLEIELVTLPGTPPRVEKVQFNDKTGTFTFAADAAPVNVVLDPNVWVLAELGEFGAQIAAAGLRAFSPRSPRRARRRTRQVQLISALTWRAARGGPGRCVSGSD